MNELQNLYRERLMLELDKQVSPTARQSKLAMKNAEIDGLWTTKLSARTAERGSTVER